MNIKYLIQGKGKTFKNEPEILTGKKQKSGLGSIAFVRTNFLNGINYI